MIFRCGFITVKALNSSCTTASVGEIRETRNSLSDLSVNNGLGGPRIACTNAFIIHLKKPFELGLQFAWTEVFVFFLVCFILSLVCWEACLPLFEVMVFGVCK